MSKFSDVFLGRVNKTYTHDFSFDNNTTMSFGFCQPLLSQYMSPGDKVNLNCKQLLRLAPMPAPTFGRIKVVNSARFVPIASVFPAFDAFVSNTSVSGTGKDYVPESLPFISQNILALNLLRTSKGRIGSIKTNSTFSPYVVDLPLGKKFPDNVDLGNFLFKSLGLPDSFPAEIVKAYVIPFFPSQSAYLVNSKAFSIDFSKQDSISLGLEGADYIINSSSNYALLGNNELLLIKLSSRSRKLRTILRGLGYSCDLSDTTSVSILPLLSYYKAWFDLYCPQRSINWHSTNAYKLINFIYNNGVSDMSKSNVFSLFVNFIDDLVDCYYSIPDDYYSVHTEKPVNVSDSRMIIPNSPNGSEGLDVSVDFMGSSLPVVSNGVDMSGVTIRTLLKYSKFINKNSVIGAKVADYIRTHYGADVADDMFGSSLNAGSFVVNADINDVFSTSDTFDVANQSGKELGSYAGKGIGYSDGKIDFRSSTFGYFLIISSVVPKSGYYQGNDGYLTALNRFEIPNTEFDGLGFELTPNSLMYDYGGVIKDGLKKLSSTSFGFIPMMSKLKYKKDIVNGDFSLRSTKDSLHSYHLEHDIIAYDLRTIDSKGKCVEFNNSIPAASTAWRFPCKYSWLGNFNRIFYNAAQPYNQLFFHQSGDFSPIDDNFILQTVFDFKFTCKLKPLSMSYDTIDSADDSKLSVGND